MQPSPELEGVVRDWFDSVARGDGSWLERHLSTDDRLRIVGTDPAEWLRGREAGDLLRADLAALGGSTKVEVLEAEAYTEGDVGWALARPQITLPDGTVVSPRWSAVFHREGGDWRAVQIHASLGVGNEQAFGEAFPTPP